MSSTAVLNLTDSCHNEVPMAHCLQTVLLKSRFTENPSKLKKKENITIHYFFLTQRWQGHFHGIRACAKK